jgi:hypothetical protein
MTSQSLALNQQTVRATDTNSLLRLYDHANAVFHTSPLQQERDRADRAIERICRELRKRKVAF